MSKSVNKSTKSTKNNKQIENIIILENNVEIEQKTQSTSELTIKSKKINKSTKKLSKKLSNKINKSDKLNKLNKSNKSDKSDKSDKSIISIDENNDITTKLVEQRNERQEINNKLAYETIKSNLTDPDENKINKKALDRLLAYTDYNNLEEVLNDKENFEEIIIKLTSLYIAKNASRQGSKDEDLQLESINTLGEYNITIHKDGKQKPIKGGGISKSSRKSTDQLKTIDFVIKYNDYEIGYITAKVTSGEGGHQDNVLDELTQFCDWSIANQKNDKGKKVYVVLYDSCNTSKLFDEIKVKYQNVNLILTNTKNFKNDFIKWFRN